MSRNQRLGLIAAAVVVLVVALVLIKHGEQEDYAPSKAKTTQPETQTAEGKTGPRPVPVVDMRDGKPAGGSKTFAFRSGDSARIDVRSNQPAEIHLHGYDIEKSVQPGRTTTVRFKADIDGIFELEDHDSDQELARIRVNPR